MPRKTLLTAAIVTLLLGAVALAPLLPAVRDAALGYLLRVVEGQGVTLTYQRSEGNLWRNVTLLGVRADGFGSTVSVDRLRIDYFLPALLGGELPLDVDVAGATGEVGLSDLDALLAGSGAPGGGGGFAPRVRLGTVHLSGVQLNARQVPFTLPEASITGLDVTNEAGDLRVAARVSTADGELAFHGTLDPSTLDFNAVIEHADATIARQWWPGARAGTVSGTLSVKRGQLAGDFELKGGAVSDLGLEAHGVSGTVKLRYPVISADVQGEGMGGHVQATGTVDVEAMNFSATGTATPSMVRAADWLLRDSFPDGLPVDAEGALQLELNVSGWEDVLARGKATGGGTVNGLPLADLETRFEAGTATNLTVDASATLGGGPVALTIASTPRGEPMLRVRAKAVDLGGFEFSGFEPGGRIGSAVLELPLGSAPDALLTADWTGQVTGAPTTIELEAQRDQDGWGAFVSGSTDAFAYSSAGVTLSGAFVFADDKLDGAINLDNAYVPGTSGPATVSLRAEGPLDALALSLDLDGPEPLTPDLAAADPALPAGLTVSADLRGSATASFAGGTLGAVQGSFGPLALRAELLEGGVRAEWTLGPVTVTGDGVGGTVSVADGRLTFSNDTLSVTGTAALTNAAAGPLEAAPGPLDLDLGLLLGAGADATWNLRVNGEHVDLSAGSSTAFGATVTGLPVRLEGSDDWAPLSGSAAALAGGGLGVSASLPANANVAGLALPAPLTLEGSLAPDMGSLEASGTLGELPLGLSADWAGTGLLAAEAAGLRLQYSVATGEWAATGTADAAELAAAVGLDSAAAAGELTLDLKGSGAEVRGPLSLTLTQPAALTLVAVGEGDAFAVSVTGDLGGLPVSGTGTVSLQDVGAAGLVGNVGPFEGVSVDTSGARGSGRVEALELGPLTVLPTPWILDFTWADLAGSLSLGGERLNVRQAGDAWTLEGGVAASVEYAGKPYALTLAPGSVGVPATSAPGNAGVPATSLTDLATLKLHGALEDPSTGARLATVEGTLSDLSVELDVAGAELAAPLPEDLRPDWRVTGRGSVDLLGGPSYQATLELTPGPSAADRTPLKARLTGRAASADLVVEGAGIYLSSGVEDGGNQLRLRATDAPLGRYLPAGFDGNASGTLTLAPGGWRGALTATITGPLSAALTFTGAGDELAVSATASGPADSTLSARGTLLPVLRLEGRLSALSEWATADLVYDAGGQGATVDGATQPGATGPEAGAQAAPAPTLSGTLRTAPFDLAELGTLPEQHLALSYDPLSGVARVSQTGDGAVTLEGDRLSGSLTVALTSVAGPVNVTAAVAGTLTDPQITATLAGALEGQVEASLADGVNARVSVPGASVVAAAPEIEPVTGVLQGPVDVNLKLTPAGTWVATAGAEVQSGKEPTRLRAELDGDGLAYSGRLLASRGGADLATVELNGEAADLEARLDLGEVDWAAVGTALGIDLEVTGGGVATFATQPLAAGLTLDLTAHTGGNDLRVYGTAPHDLHLALSGPAGELDGALTWTTEAGGQPRANLEGHFGATPVNLSVSADASGGGTLTASYGEAHLSAVLSPEQSAEGSNGAGTRRTVTATLTAPAGSVIAYGLTADATAEVVGTDVTLDALTASLTGLLENGAPVELRAAGAVTGGLNLRGTLSTPALQGDAGVTLVADHFSLTWRDLKAEATTDLASFALRGSASADDVRDLLHVVPTLPPTLEELGAGLTSADLTWSKDRGFAGDLEAAATLDLNLDPLEGRVRLGLQATGNGVLNLTAGAWLDGEAPVASGTLTLAADPLGNQGLTGAITVALPLQALVEELSAVPTTLGADLSLGGTFAGPTVSGTASLTGELEAGGPVTYSGGTAAVRLEGEALTATLDAQVAATGLDWRAGVQLSGLDLSPWLPQVTAPRLAITAQADAGGVTVEELALSAPGTLVSGSGRFGFQTGGLRVGLDAQLDLADLDLGTSLSGTLTGPLTLAAPDLSSLSGATITTALDAAGVSVAGLGGSLSGSVSLSGAVTDPVFSANLQGEGALRGALIAGGRPLAGELRLTSNLSLGELATDLRANLQDGTASASGSARYGEAVLLFSNGRGADGSRIVMTGAGRLTGWTAWVAADLGSAELEGDLASIDPGLGGALALALNGGQSGDWLQADVKGAVAAGIELGHVSVSAASPLGRLEVTSPHLQGTFSPTGGQWTATVSALEVGAGVAVSARGSGVLDSGRLDATANGPGLDLGLELTSGGGGAVVVKALGSAYGGAVTATVRRGGGGSGAWTGSVGVVGAAFGDWRVSALGTVQGVGALPQVVLDTNAAGPLDAVGRASVSSAGVTLDQVISGGHLTKPVRIQGRMLPTTDLVVATLAEVPGKSASLDLPVTSQVRLRSIPGAGLHAVGAARLEFGPLRLSLAGQDSTPTLDVQVTGLPQLHLSTELRAPDLVALASQVVADGLLFHGEDGVRGTALVTLDPEPALELAGFGLNIAGVDVEADGRASLAAADLHGTVVLVTDLPLTGGGDQSPTGTTEYSLPWTLTTADGVWQLAYDGPFGVIRGDYAPNEAPDAVTLDVDLKLSGGEVRARLDHVGGQLSGSLEVSDLRLDPPGLGSVALDVTSSVGDGRVGGSATLESDAGRVTLTGSWGLAGILPAALAEGAPTGGRLEARLRTLEISRIPVLHDRAPYLSGAVTGVVQLRDQFVFGQLVSPEVSAGGSTSQLELSLSGSLASLDANLRLKGLTLNANLKDDHVSGVGRFERFPAQILAQAVVGPSDVTADVTGVLRFDVPLSDALSGYLRLATEEVRLERAGVPTLGNVTVTLDQGSLVVERAEFVGLGRWEAQGRLTRDDLDFHLEAVDADFTPLLGLFPSLARIGMGAEGTFTFVAGGDVAHPTAKLSSPNLDVEVAGSRYRLEDTDVTLSGTDLTLAAQLSGVSPLSGSLDVTGGARVTLVPAALTGVQVDFGGSLDVPGIGVVEDVKGALTQDASGALVVETTGRMGAGELQVKGGLVPLDLHATGTGLSVAFPAVLVANALTDMDLTLTSEPGGVALGGAINASEVILDPSVAAAPAAEAEAGGTPAAAGTARAPPPAPVAGPNPMAALRFSNLVISAPQRVLLTTSLGSGEAALDLVLSGNAAEPRLAGTATALRGNLRFSGRDFTVDRAVATFSPGRGVFPELDVAAHTEFDKSRVEVPGGRVSFTAPREGQTFVVNLAFTGEMLPAPPEEGGFKFDLKPRVSSDARIDVEGEGPGSGIRPFTDAELLSLITLGRFELNADLIGSGGLGAAVAQGALDTAVDVLVVSELANALRQALGLDVVEIRTSALSSLLDDTAQPFGVSLRLGGYLNPDLFASYRIGTYDGPDRAYSFTNEVQLSYGLGPLDLDITTRIDFPAAGVPDSPRPELGVALSYAFSQTFGADAGVILNTDRSAFQVGLTLRW
ncbi:MAG: translocation/assembly module TamB domain-containing protein [Truepera sp.]|nr:translocation/assembly module TamB domain-containing protein [Truepera sp.]